MNVDEPDQLILQSLAEKTPVAAMVIGQLSCNSDAEITVV